MTSAMRSAGLIYRKRCRWAQVDPIIPIQVPAGPPSLVGSSRGHTLFAAISCCPPRVPTRTIILNPTACIDSLPLQAGDCCPFQRAHKAIWLPSLEQMRGGKKTREIPFKVINISINVA